MGNVLSEMKFGKVAPGLVRLGMNGQMAIKIGSDYKYYKPGKDGKIGRLVNCDNFVFNLGEEFFFVMPTNKVKKGDIIIASGKPVYVLAAEDDGQIKVLSYEDNSVKNILPERHTFLGGTYMYSKIVSMFGNKGFDKNSIMKYMMINSMMGGNGAASLFGGSGSSTGGMNPMMLMMLMGGKNPLGGLFDVDADGEGLFGNLGFLGSDDEESDEEDEDDDEEVTSSKKSSK